MKNKVKLNLTTKVVFSVVMLAVFGVLGFIYLFDQSQTNTYRTSHRKTGLSIANALDSGVNIDNISDPIALQGLVNKSIYLNPEILLIDINKLEGEGLTTFMSNDASRISNNPDEENIKAAKENSVHTEIQGKGVAAVMRIITPIHLTGQSVGSYEIHLSMASSYRELNQKIFQSVIISLIMVIIFAIFLIFLLNRILIAPIERLKNGIEELTTTNPSFRFTSFANDEFGLLATALNQAYGKISAFNSELEQKIKDKTQALNNKLTELNLLNKSLESNKTAMLNLLEDAKELEDKLAEEKQGVEKKVVERTRQLQEEHIKLKSSIDSLNVGFVMTDTNKNIVIINPIAKAIFCHPERRSSRIGALKGPDVIERECTLEDIEKTLKDSFNIRAAIDECLSKKNPIEVKEVPFGDRFFHIFLSPIVTFSERKVKELGVVILFENVTESKILQRAREDGKKQ